MMTYLNVKNIYNKRNVVEKLENKNLAFHSFGPAQIWPNRGSKSCCFLLQLLQNLFHSSHASHKTKEL